MGKLRGRLWLMALSLAVAAMLSVRCQAGQGETEGEAMQVREPIIAGSWYPGKADALKEMVRGFLDKVEPQKVAGRPVALVVPHAGLIYSGQVAAYAYKQLEGRKLDLIVLVGPSHRAYLSGCSVWTPGAWRTPLGLVEVNDQVAAALTRLGPSVVAAPEAHATEHSLEIQLPFVQEVCPQAKIVPVMMGPQNLEAAQGLAKALVAALRDHSGSYALVASSDLSHFHPYGAAVGLDRVACGHIERLDAEGLAADMEAGKCEACGGGPVLAVMLAAKELGATKAEVLKYANSGDVTGDHSRVVGYLAAVLAAEGGNPGKVKAAEEPAAKAEGEAAPGGLGAGERKLLHEIALKAVHCAARGEEPPEVRVAQAALLQRCGAFVTLKRGGRLRGCIGNIFGTEPLGETVARMAKAAATSDPRFPPLRSDELKGLEIEISVLTPLELVKDPSEIIVGKHGLYIVYGMSRGLLLPQVAVEQGWDRQTFLEQTCWKAGLPPSAWRNPRAEIYRFAAEVF